MGGQWQVEHMQDRMTAELGRGSGWRSRALPCHPEPLLSGRGGTMKSTNVPQGDPSRDRCPMAATAQLQTSSQEWGCLA